MTRGTRRPEPTISTVIFAHDYRPENRIIPAAQYIDHRSPSALKGELIEEVDDNIVRFDRLGSHTCYSHVDIHCFRRPVMT